MACRAPLCYRPSPMVVIYHPRQVTGWLAGDGWTPALFTSEGRDREEDGVDVMMVVDTCAGASVML